jgi:hypothetical protein
MNIENHFIKLLECEFKQIICAEISGKEPSRIRILEILEEYKEISINKASENNHEKNVLYIPNTEEKLIEAIEKQNKKLRKIKTKQS